MQTVVGLAGTLVRLAGYDGQASAAQLAHLLASEGFGFSTRLKVLRNAGPRTIPDRMKTCSCVHQ